ncbi:MAG: putative endonuclease [Sphingomonas echinoides]|jgi:putative endonuclease
MFRGVPRFESPSPNPASGRSGPRPDLKDAGHPSPEARKREGNIKRRHAEASGRRGERIAGWWLRLKGWRILARRVRTPAGEVDLIAKRGTLIAFVEVKLRKTAAELDFAIDERRLSRVAAAAEYLMPSYADPGDDIRVDVILLAPGTRPRHIENAWLP